MTLSDSCQSPGKSWRVGNPSRAPIHLRRAKCRIGYSEIEFVGHVITAEGHRPLPRLIEKIKIQKRPSSLRQLKAFLVLLNYYREFLPNVAQVSSPLYNLTLVDCRSNGIRGGRRVSFQ